MPGRSQFDEKLRILYQDTIYLGTMVEEYLKDVIEAFSAGDTETARALIERDKKIDEMQIKMEQESVMLLLLEAPVAKDLRKIITSVKIFANLERIGDYACHLAKLTVKGDRTLFPQFVEPIAGMARSGAEMIRESLTAYIEDNEVLAMKTAASDASIDKAKKSIIAQLIMLTPANEAEMKQIYRYLSICKDLDRLGDHITSICEWGVFTVRGEIVDLGKLMKPEE